MKEAILFENSALSEYRASTLPVESKKLYLLQDVLKNFHFNLEDSLITDHQYLEVSGKGQIRAEIVKEYRELINTAKPSVVTDIQNTVQLQNYIVFLENLFSRELRKRLPRWKIYDILKETLKKYPIDSELGPIKRKLYNHGSSLLKFPAAYECFVNLLIEDSVTRYALAFLNFREIPEVQYD